MVERIEMAAGVDQLGELRVADRDARRDAAHAARLFLEIPDEFAAGAFLCEAAAVLCENCDARAEQGAAHGRDQRHALHQIEDFRRIGVAGAGLAAAQ